MKVNTGLVPYALMRLHLRSETTSRGRTAGEGLTKRMTEVNLSLNSKKRERLHVWGAIIHGKNFPLDRFPLRPAHVVNKVKIAADTITADVYLAQILSGPLKDAVAWAKADGREAIIVGLVRTVSEDLRRKGPKGALSVSSTLVLLLIFTPLRTAGHGSRTRLDACPAVLQAWMSSGRL
jgi:hypothetical protein